MTAPKEGTGFLALELDGDGAHPAAWRTARHTPAELLSGERIRSTVLAAESAGFHVATFSDGPAAAAGNGTDIAGRLDAVQRAAFAGPVTRRIVLVPEVDTVYTEPFHVATQLASLDYVSGGRAGWLVAAGTDQEAAAVGRPVADLPAKAAEAAASIEVGRRLWDSWEDDAVIRDVATGRYLDADKLHYADFETGPNFPGTGYSVKGPAIIPRPLQGQLPVLVPASLLGGTQQAGTPQPGSQQGTSKLGEAPQEGAWTDGVDAVLLSAPAPENLAADVAKYRRGIPADVAVIAELDVVLDARGQTAEERVAELDAHTPWHSSRARYMGPAAGLAELLVGVLAVANGVRLHPAVLDVDLDELSRLVLPELRRRGVLAGNAPDATFRDLLGLDRPVNRYALTGS